MKDYRALLSALLLGGACTSALAQRKIVETAPGTQNSLTTNTPAPATPPRVPGGNLFDQLTRPGGLQLIPPDAGPSPNPGGGAGPLTLDPVVRKRLMEEQSRKKNWAIENAARINRNGGEIVTERRRTESDGRRPAGAGREPTAAEIRLQAVDPKYAREFQKTTAPAAESAYELGRRPVRPGERNKDPNAPKDPNGPSDPSEADRRLGSNTDPESPDKTKDAAADRWGKSPLDSIVASPRLESAVDRAAAEQGNDILSGGKGAAEALSPRLESLRAARDNDLAEILGNPANRSGGGNPLTDGFMPSARSTRLAEFQQLLGTDSRSPVVAKAITEGTAAAPTELLGKPGAASGVSRELPGFSTPAGVLNLGPGPTAAAVAPPPRLLPQPTQLPFPVRGKNGF